MYWVLHTCIDQVDETLKQTEMFWHRFDKFGRPVLYLRPAKQDMKKYVGRRFAGEGRGSGLGEGVGGGGSMASPDN